MQLFKNFSPSAKDKKAPSTLRRVGVYTASRVMTIGLTILIGIFFTVVVANKNGGIDLSISQQLNQKAKEELLQKQGGYVLDPLAFQEEIAARTAELEEEAGLNAPFLLRHLRWTWNALRLDLGTAVFTDVRASSWTSGQTRDEIRRVILTHLPNTLLLFGLADLFVFVIGIPLSLHLSRHYGSWFDKLMNLFSPLSSVPSWVHGVLLILFFSITVKIFPPGGMIDIPIPGTKLGVIFSRIKHLILPVSAIIINLLFQLVYSWRNYLMIYSEEDYVEYAVAQGLPASQIQKEYILRPSLPYVLTSFALTLAGFWQMTTALEVVFDWDGIGKLYIVGMPHFWNDVLFPGEMTLIVGIVVIFAYLLGMVVLLLDVAYALVDPRIRVGSQQERVKAIRSRMGESFFKRLKTFFTSGRAVVAKLFIWAIGLAIVGGTVGLVFGWQAWPVQYADAAPADMHYNFQFDYMRMVIDSFSQNENSGLAKLRMDALGKNVNLILDDLLTQFGNDPDFRDKVTFFAQEYDPGASTAEINSPLSTGAINRTLNGQWLIAVSAIGGIFLIGAGTFYFAIVRNRNHLGTKHLVLLSGAAFLLGLALGLLLSWQIWPVEFSNASPANLAQTYQTDYVCMLVDSFNASQDQELARMRLDALGEGNAAAALQYILEHPTETVLSDSAIWQFANNFDVSIPGSAILTLPERQVVEKDNSRLMIGSLALVLVVLVVIGIVVIRKRQSASSDYPKTTLRERAAGWQKRWQSFWKTIREMSRYKSAVAGMIILALMIAGSLYAVIVYPYNEIGMSWFTDALENSAYIPKSAKPTWVNWFRKNDLPETIIINSSDSPETKTVDMLENGNRRITFTFTFDYPYIDFPNEGMLYFDAHYENKKPFATFTWITPDGREFPLDNYGIEAGKFYKLADHVDSKDLDTHLVEYDENDVSYEPLLNGLFMNPGAADPEAVKGQYILLVEVSTFEPDSDVDLEMVLLGQIYGAAGTDYMRRDLLVPLLWGMPFALGIGLAGAIITTLVSMTFAAFGVWVGGWADMLVQRVTEANMIIPVVAISVLFYAFYGASLWTVLIIIVVLNAFGSPTKTFRAAFIQVKQSGYIEAAQAYGASNSRIIFHYMIPRILPVLIPQLVTLIPGFIFLEATLGMFNVKSIFPTWGKVIYEALSHGAAWGSRFWVLEPIALLLLTGFAFSMMGFALDKVLNPRLQSVD